MFTQITNPSNSSSKIEAKIKSLKDDKSKEKLKEVYVSTKKEIEGIIPGSIIDDSTYNTFAMKYGSMFDADIGAEAIYKIFKDLDLQTLIEKLEKRLDKIEDRMERLEEGMFKILSMR